MEFERRSKKGKAKAREDGEDLGESLKAQSDADAIREGLKARREAEREEELQNDASSSASTSTATKRDDEPISPEALHNLDVAQGFLSTGRLDEASHVSLRLAAIRIEGAKSLRPSFLGRLCRPYMDQTLQSTILNRLIYSHRLDHILPGQKASLSSILELTQSIGMDLTSLDLFNDIDATLRPSTIGHSAEDVDVILSCQEKGRYFLKTSTDVGNGEGNATIQARIRNCFGGAERAEFSATMGTKTTRSFNASLLSPLFASPDNNISCSAYALDRDLTSFASLVEGVRGLRMALHLQPGGLVGSHEIAFDVMHRHLSKLLPTASLGIQRQSGHSIKSSLSHLYTFDNRNDPFLSTTGHYLKFFQELAGFGGDAQHYKVEGEGQFSRVFHNGFGYSLTSQVGLIRSLNRQKAPLFCDRFQLGGPVSIRAFRYNSLGPKDGLDSLGGDLYYALGASLFAPIPSKPEWPLKLHSFFNAGQLIQLDPKISFYSPLNQHLIKTELLAKPSSSIGLGMMYRQGNLRAEVNFGLPLTIRANDGVRKGIQLGIGISFM